jgi:BlaI family transcriptional regulator, penicillinase repressor
MANRPFSDGARHAILDLAPLELDCMNALWLPGEATVREIQQALSCTRPRAYTTIMTIMDRLARKGIVMRRKNGKAWVYRPILSAEEARAHAVAQVVQGFFDGSSEALVAHLSAQGIFTVTDRVPGQQRAEGSRLQAPPGPNNLEGSA